MAENVSDEAFARYVNQIGHATFDQIEAARAAQAESAKKGIHLSLGEVLVQQGMLTQAVRENIEKKALAQQAGGLMQLGPYKLIKKLGEGGMGVVYLAENTSVGGKVAVKVLARKYSEQGEFLTRFRREALAAGRLNHANIVTAYDVGEDAGTHYYAMEYCDGETLDRILKREEYLPWDKAIAVTIQVARGLKHAHDHGIIHRDVKPANVFVCRPLAPGGEGDGGEGDVFAEGFVAKILDLGLSKNIGSSEQSYLTETGTVLGTPHYISPEQARGDKGIDGRTDIYSLGATLYNLVTGHTPFSGMSAGVVMMKHLSEQLPNPQDINADIPDGVVHIIQKMMAKEAGDRYANCAELLADLELASQGKQPSSARLHPALTTIATRRKGAQAKAAKPEVAWPGAALVRKRAEPVPLEPLEAVEETLVRKDTTLVAASEAPAPPGSRNRNKYIAAGAAALVLLVAAAALALRAKPETQNPKPEGNSKPETTATVTGTQAAKPETANLKPETKVWPLHNGKEPIADYAKRVGVAATETLDLGGGVKMELVLVPAGEFMMGADNEGGNQEKPAHKVKISQPYYIGKYDVTVAQFRAFAEAMEFQTEAEKGNGGVTLKDGKWEYVRGVNWQDPGFKQEENHPVVVVTWNTAQEYCKWATKLAGRTVRLPTEAEWEYAARGPQSSKYPWGDKWEGIMANVADASLRRAGFDMRWGEIKEDDGFPYTSPVGHYEESASWCGAFDMAGNVWQWCQDYFNDKYYGESPAVDPQGPATGRDRVIRGGCWDASPFSCRSMHRFKNNPGTRNADHGFRVVVVCGSSRTP